MRLLISLILTATSIVHASTAFAEPVDSTLNQAIGLYRQGQYEDANLLLQDCQALAPDSPKVLYYLAITAVQLNDLDQARGYYQQALKLQPQGPLAEMAQKGLQQLNALETSQIDPPPNLNPIPPRKTPPGAVPMPNLVPQAQTTVGPQVAQQMMTPQAMEALQAMLMMQSMNGMNMTGQQNPYQQNNSGNDASWMMPYLYGNQGNTGNQAGTDPMQAQMQSMMMQQMLQNFDSQPFQNNSED